MSIKKFENVLVSASGQAVVVTGRSDEYIDDRPVSGEASATELRPGVWWVNRVLVQPEAVRGQGLGGQLLDALLESITAKPAFKKVMVEPGGYNLPVGRQRRFYKRHGFKRVKAIPGVLCLKRKGANHAKASVG